MSDRIPSAPPVILPYGKNAGDAILWSVMIPVYNCISFLAETIQSVLAQNLGEENMQIEVVDDCSTDGDVEMLVKTVGQGRVQYFKQPQNRGSLRNFETCINRAKGQWVHILHGDDVVEKGYYAEVEKLFNTYPEAGAAFTNNNFISTSGENLFVKKALLKEAGLLPGFLLQIAKRQLLEPAAITVKRSVYENLGSFYAVHYAEDWEMWTRIAANYPVAYSPKCLAAYRVLDDENITKQSYLTAQNVKDVIKVIDIIQTYLPPQIKIKYKNIALKHYAVYFSQVANNLFPAQKKAAVLQAKSAWKMHRNVGAFYYIVKLYCRILIS